MPIKKSSPKQSSSQIEEVSTDSIADLDDDENKPDHSIAQTRAIAFIAQILATNGDLPLNAIFQSQDWGSVRTFQRMRQNINKTWEKVTGRPLFVEVNQQGEIASRGKTRFVRLTTGTHLTASAQSPGYLLATWSLLEPLLGSTLLGDVWRQARQSIENQLSRRERSSLKDISKKFCMLPRTPLKLQRHRQVFDQILQALDRQYLIKIKYANGKKSAYVKPLSLMIWHETYYLIGRKIVDRQEENEKNWRIDGITEVVPLTDQVFDYPKNFSPLQLRKKIFGFIQQANAPTLRVTVLVKSPSLAYDFLSGRQLSDFDSWSNVGDGLNRLAFNAANIDEVVTLLLGFGADVIVEQPQELREQMIDEIRRLSACYALKHIESA